MSASATRCISDRTRQRARVVGTVVMPAVGTYQGADKAGLGEGMLVTPHALKTLGPNFDTDSDSIAVETSPGVTLRSFERAAARLGMPTDAGLQVTQVPAPSDITALRRLRSTPSCWPPCSSS